MERHIRSSIMTMTKPMNRMRLQMPTLLMTKRRKKQPLLSPLPIRHWQIKAYTIKTASSSELILYGVDPLPEVTTVQMDKQNYSSADNKINLTWTGNDKMSDLEKLDIYILENPDSEENGGTPIASLTGADIAKGKAAITIPDTMESGKVLCKTCVQSGRSHNRNR